jgi:methionyl-tRNA formyltransferase
MALTGFGNEVLSGLLNANIFKKINVATRKEQGKFPYYACEQLTDLCQRQHVPCYTDLDQINPDFILVATLDKILPGQVLGIPRFGAVNIHPSLLPLYRGPTPTNWAIINGETISGITYHRLSDKIDSGQILSQFRCDIENMNDGQLRHQLAKLAGKTVGEFLYTFLNSELSSQSKDVGRGFYFPKVTSSEGIALLQSGRFKYEDIVRGLTPYPGIQILSTRNRNGI